MFASKFLLRTDYRFYQSATDGHQPESDTNNRVIAIELLQNNDVIISDQEAMSSILGLLSRLCCNANYLGDFCDPKCWGEFLVLNFVCSKCSWCTKYLKKFYLKWKAQGRHQIFLNFISPKNVYYGIFCQTIA